MVVPQQIVCSLNAVEPPNEPQHGVDHLLCCAHILPTHSDYSLELPLHGEKPHIGKFILIPKWNDNNIIASNWPSTSNLTPNLTCYKSTLLASRYVLWHSFMLCAGIAYIPPLAITISEVTALHALLSNPPFQICQSPNSSWSTFPCSPSYCEASPGNLPWQNWCSWTPSPTPRCKCWNQTTWLINLPRRHPSTLVQMIPLTRQWRGALWPLPNLVQSSKGGSQQYDQENDRYSSDLWF